MITRKQFLEDIDGLFQAYFLQFANKAMRENVLDMFTEEEIKAAYEEDKNLNTCGELADWDDIAVGGVRPSVVEAAGDIMSMALGVCVAKAVAIDIIGEGE